MGLIIVGILLIFYALFFSAEVFLLKKEPPEIFQPKELAVTQVVKQEEPETEEETQKEEEKEREDVKEREYIAVKEAQATRDYPIEEFFNVISVAIFSGIVIFGGTKIAAIGVSIVS